MIRHIYGTVAHLGPDHVVIDVGGIGYQVYTPAPARCTLDTKLKLHTHQAIRETASDLYGFLTLDELAVFEQLLTLPKIGPKSAAQVMAQADLSILTTAVQTNDPAHLTKLGGIGKKTAEKIVAGLQDSFIAEGYGADGADGSAMPESTHQADAIDALVALGYPHSDARKAVQNLPDTITNTNEAVAAALKELSHA